MPPERDPFEPFPETVPWDTPISELSNWWLAIQGASGRSIDYPLRLMAARRGWRLTLREIVPRLKDDEGRRPASVMLKTRGLELRRLRPGQGFHVLLGDPPSDP